MDQLARTVNNGAKQTTKWLGVEPHGQNLRKEIHLEEFESLKDASNERANNDLVQAIAKAGKFDVEIVTVKESSLDGQPIVAGEVLTPHGKATFNFLKTHAVRSITGTVLNITLNEERKSKFVKGYHHALNTIAKLCGTESYWNNFPTK